MKYNNKWMAMWELTPVKTPTSLRHKLLVGIFQGSFPLWFSPLAWWLAMSPYRFVAGIGELALALNSMLIWLFLAALLSLLTAPLFLFWRSKRKVALHYAPVSLVFVPCFLGGMYFGKRIWQHGIDRFVIRSKPLVSAITTYQTTRGRPPGSLDDLVPGFLPRIPITGLGSSGEYFYLVDKPAQNFEQNPWVLRVVPPCELMRFDQILYFPRQNYPATGYGGSLERIGNWAYVHD